jgi:hypothetical protein
LRAAASAAAAASPISGRGAAAGGDAMRQLNAIDAQIQKRIKQQRALQGGA